MPRNSLGQGIAGHFRVRGMSEMERGRAIDVAGMVERAMEGPRGREWVTAREIAFKLGRSVQGVARDLVRAAGMGLVEQEPRKIKGDKGGTMKPVWVYRSKPQSHE